MSSKSDKPLTRRILRRGLAIAAWVLGVGLVTLLSAYLHLATPVGRTALATAVSRFASGQVVGRLEVRGITSTSLPSLRMNSIRAWHPDGEEVLQLRNVRAHLDLWGSLVDRGLHVDHLYAEETRVVVVNHGEGKPTIEVALDSASSAEEPPTSRRVLDVRGIEWGTVDVTVAVSHAPLHFHVTGGRGRLWVRERGKFQARFIDLRGRLASEMTLVPNGRYHAVHLVVDPDRPAIVSFSGRAHSMDVDATLAGHVPDADGEGVRLCMWTEKSVSLASLAGIGVEVFDAFTSAVSFDLRHGPPPDDLRCEDES